MQPPRPAPGAVAAAADEQHAVMRGVVHSIILSMAAWTAALYLTLVLG